MVKDGEELWGYYFADHERRVVFWFEDHRSRTLTNYIRGVERKSHIKYALESQYWQHIELFPNRRFLPEDVVVELRELIILQVFSTLSICPDSNARDPSILHVYPLRHGLASGHTIISWTSQ
ncbi:hypothetical protein EDB19DRAFT_1798801 [Suillus lakei]|nr:hypothetical protein EDB19DRAFT_1798801 [Suillus lakei]